MLIYEQHLGRSYDFARESHLRKAVRSSYEKVKVAHTRLPSVGFRSSSRFLAVSLQVT